MRRCHLRTAGTCELTQLGFIRLASNPAAIATAKSPHEATGLLKLLVADSLHIYLDSLPPPASEDWRDAFATILGHQQVTDAYLLKLAAVHKPVLVTFDRRFESVSAGKRGLESSADIPRESNSARIGFDYRVIAVRNGAPMISARL